MSVESRLRTLEDSAGINSAGINGEDCACPRFNTDVRYYPGETSQADADADQRPAEVCAFCGRAQQIIKIVLVRNWRDDTKQD
jgi:hypothetical protein